MSRPTKQRHDEINYQAVKELSQQMKEMDKITMDSPPKMPRLMKDVYSQIERHPNYPTLSPGTLFAYNVAAKGGFSHCTTQNNKWTRTIWKFLYLGQPMDE
jgi:menaquinone-dependent protoporphyrinogen IX oxidase